MNRLINQHALKYSQVLALLAMFFTNSQVALSQEELAAQPSAAAVNEEVSTAPAKDLNIEIKPAGFGLNILPGMFALGFGVEKHLDANWSLFSEVGLVSARISQSDIDKLTKDEDNKKPVVKGLDALSLGLGGRYYFQSTTNNSWYAGARASFLRMRAKWAHGSERIHQDSSLVGPAIEGGYRWVGDSGWNARLGLTAQLAKFGPTTYSSDSGSPQARETEDRIKKGEVIGGNSFLAKYPIGVDFGVGYMF